MPHYQIICCQLWASRYRSDRGCRSLVDDHSHQAIVYIPLRKTWHYLPNSKYIKCCAVSEDDRTTATAILNNLDSTFILDLLTTLDTSMHPTFLDINNFHSSTNTHELRLHSYGISLLADIFVTCYTKILRYVATTK